MEQDQKVNILLVDDIPANLIALEALLEELNQNLVKAHSAEEALRFLLNNDCAVILLDVQMPGIDGFEAARLIHSRERSKHTPIIFLTAISREEENIFRGYASGAVDYIVKPVVPEILKAKVSVFVELYKQKEEIKRQKLEINQAYEANRLKDEFLATLSHELRTPLTAVLGWIRLLRSGTLDQEGARKAIDTIERNAKAQAKLIEDILDVSRIITGKMHLDVKPLDLTPIIKESIDIVKPAADAKEITITARLDATVKLISGDKVRIQQVMWNLLSNAVKFTPPGGSVEVVLTQSENYSQVTISDNGIGIPPAFLHNVFNRFSQADTSTIREYGGLGLGLAIVRHLVELHGGAVEVYSEGKDKGSAFVVKLPLLSLPAAKAEAREEISYEPPQPAPVTLKGIKILYVEDDPDTREMLVLMLENVGAEVKAAFSVMDALSVLDSWWPDILISDISLPGKDGYQLIDIMRKLEQRRGLTIPAIALTALARVEDRIKALSAGFSTHIPKPIEPTEVISAITSLLKLNHKRNLQ